MSKHSDLLVGLIKLIHKLKQTSDKTIVRRVLAVAVLVPAATRAVLDISPTTNQERFF